METEVIVVVVSNRFLVGKTEFIIRNFPIFINHVLIFGKAKEVQTLFFFKNS